MITFTKQQSALGIPKMQTMASSFVFLTFMVMSLTTPVVEAAYSSSPTYYDVNAEINNLDSSETGGNQPKQSYNKKRRIKGELKRRTLYNQEEELEDSSIVHQEEEAAIHKTKGNDDEDLEHFLRYLQFSVAVRTYSTLLKNIGYGDDISQWVHYPNLPFCGCYF